MNRSPPPPGLWVSTRDALLVARFELIRAVRTWQALALIAMYLVATGGGGWIFVQILAEAEGALADTLRVARAPYPGTLTAELVHNSTFREMVGAMVGDDRLVDTVLAWPFLAVFHLWLSLLIVPYLATFTSAESISADLRTRAVRFELLRTGRLELAVGRFVGQALLTLFAGLLAGSVTVAVGLGFMAAQSPIDLAWGAAVMSLRAWSWGLPFVGIGLLCSQLTASPAWARVLAIGATSGTWVAYGLTTWAAHAGYGVWVAPIKAVLPSVWVRMLWEGGLNTGAAALYFASLGLAATWLGHQWRSRRDA